MWSVCRLTALSCASAGFPCAGCYCLTCNHHPLLCCSWNVCIFQQWLIIIFYSSVIVKEFVHELSFPFVSLLAIKAAMCLFDFASF